MIGVGAIAEVAALLGDPARANMMFAVKEDGVIAAGDLSIVAGIAPSTASEHLAKLCQAGLLKMTARGRRRYYSLADPKIAEVLEAIEALAGRLSKRQPEELRWDQGLVHARACLDHLAGSMGGSIADAALERKLLRQRSRGLEMTAEGAAWMASLGIDFEALEAEPRRLLRLCPDWIDDSMHIGGAVGAALLKAFVDLGWLRRVKGSPRVQVTPKGVSSFRTQLGLDVRELQHEKP